ncbi:MAG: hypothetical protein Q4Q53_08895, partial [Methanocorpusculum sp.]|nr:hypothetical protein [Methanocorpusculum sp.]
KKDLREDLPKDSEEIVSTKLTINATANCPNENSPGNSIEFGVLQNDNESRDFQNIQNILPEKDDFSEKIVTDNSLLTNKSKEELEKKESVSNELFEKTDSLFSSEELKGSSVPRSDGIIEFGTLEPEESLLNDNVHLSENKEDRKQESRALPEEINPQLKAAEAFGNESSEVWDLQLNPQNQGAVLFKEENKAKAKNFAKSETEKSIFEGDASILPVDEEVAKRVKFVPSDFCSDISFTPRVQEKFLDKNEFSFHNGHDLNDLVMPCAPDRIIDKLQKIDEFGDCDRSEIFQDLSERDLQIEKAHSAAFEQERLDEEKRKEEGHEARINSVFKQIYDQKK